MENASKALLIAGAIIVVLVIIAIGMLVLNSTTGIFGTATKKMSDQEKQLFNETFTMYEGNISGSQMKSLLQAVMSNNNNPDNGEVTVNKNKVTTTNGYPKDDGSLETIKSAATYNVEIKAEGYKNGLVQDITVGINN